MHVSGSARHLYSIEYDIVINNLCMDSNITKSISVDQSHNRVVATSISYSISRSIECIIYELSSFNLKSIC